MTIVKIIATIIVTPIAALCYALPALMAVALAWGMWFA